MIWAANHPLIAMGVLLLAVLIIAIFGWPPFTGGASGDFLRADKYSDFETGVRRHSNGVLEVSALTRMPNVTPEMVRWWFGDYLETTEQYKRWHPTDHIWYDWENKVPGNHIGASGLVHEYIGKDLFKLRIQFVSPENILGQPNALGPDDVAICAHPGLLEKPYYSGKMCHVIRSTDYGAEMRSRFWLGLVSKREGNEAVFSFEALLANTYLARRLAIGKSDGVDLITHAVEEMGYLADLLPELYRAETSSLSSAPETA